MSVRATARGLARALASRSVRASEVTRATATVQVSAPRWALATVRGSVAMWARASGEPMVAASDLKWADWKAPE